MHDRRTRGAPIGARRACAAVPLVLGLFAHASSAQTATLTPVPGPQDYALVDMGRFPVVGEQAVQRGETTGRRRFLLAANTTYRLFKLDRASLRVGYVEFRSGPDGSRFVIPPVPLRDLSAAHDLDGDGLSDLAEFVVGTDPTDPDTDGDGVLDGAAVQAGTLNEPLLRTGLIASVQLPGIAQDVCALNDMAVVALGPAGVAVTNVYTRMNPLVIGLVDTPGDARRVACAGTLVAVAGGTGGLAVVDVSDPPITPIVHQVSTHMLGGNAQCVTALAGLALVGLSTGDLVTIDLASGTVLETVRVSTRPLQDVVVSGDAVYVLDTTTLHALALEPGRLAVSSSVASPFVAGVNVRLFVGGGVAYVVHGTGTNTFGLANPLQPVLIRASSTGEFGWKQIALNGSGLALAAVSPNSTFDGPHEVRLYDASDPTQTNVVLAQFETPGIARSVALFNGLCYAADDARGLQVINYLAQDRQGIAPTISLSTNQPSLDRAQEGSLLRVSAACTDDVQVRSCELFVNGVKTETDGNFPFDFYLVTPRLFDRQQLSIRVRVSDTGGNSQFSDELVIELTPDSVAPSVVRVSPPDGGLLGNANVVAAFFNEPIDPNTLTGASFHLTSAGADRAFGTADDRPISASTEFRAQVLGAFLTPVDGALAPGQYRAVLEGATDPGGNQTPTTTWQFTVYGAGGLDSDGDGIPDELERVLGLDPDVSDSNGNGVPDGQEDLDGDGVPNAIEVVLLTDLRSTDSDADGVPDALEDQDGDRLPDWREVVAGTSIFDHDTDDDTFTDNDELLGLSDPLDSTSVPLRSASSATTTANRAPPGYSLGVELVDVTVKNAAAPEATTGQTQSAPTSVQNDAP